MTKFNHVANNLVVAERAGTYSQTWYIQLVPRKIRAVPRTNPAVPRKPLQYLKRT